MHFCNKIAKFFYNKIITLTIIKCLSIPTSIFILVIIIHIFVVIFKFNIEYPHKYKIAIMNNNK